MKPQDFTATYGPLAEDISKETGLAPETVLSIVAQETGFGDHFIGNNIFGISPGGKVAQYPSIQAAGKAFVDLVKTRYSDASGGATPEDQVRLLSARGYNPNPAYPGAVVQHIATVKGQQTAQSGGDDLLARMQRLAPAGAPQAAPGGAASGQPTAAPEATAPSSDDLLARMNRVAPPPQVAPPPPPPEPPLGDNAMGDQGGMGGSSLPAAPAVTAGDVRSFLAPAPNTVYGDVLPLARDTQTGKLRLAMPNALRMPLQGLAAGPEAGATIDPGTGQLGITPEAASVVPFVATPLRFSGANPLQFVPPGSLERPPLPAGATALNPDAAARIRAAQGGPVSIEPPAVSTPFNTEPVAPTADAGPTSLPTGVPVTPPGAPSLTRGGAVGADITTAPIPPKTPVERVRDLEKTVLQTAEDRAGPRMQDDTQYVPGIPPRLLAGRDFSTSVNALDEKIATAKDPAFRDTVDRNNRDRNQGMIDFLRNDAQDANALDQAYEFRKQVSPKEMGVFDGEQPVNAEGLLSKVDTLLNGPEGKQKAVRNTLNDVRASLFDADGNLETLPSRLYGARKNLTDLLQRGVKGTGELADDVRASKHHLEGLVEDFDPLITGGAPRFTDYLKEWSARSKPIDQMEFLQQYQTGAKKLTNDTGYLQPNKVQKMLDDVLQANKARGVNKAKSLTDEQIANIEAVRNELQAQQLQDRLASVRGSDTFQQFSRPFLGEGAAANALRHGLDVVGGISTGGLYNFAIKPGLQANRERRIQRKTELRKQQLLEPPNPLTPP